MSLSNDLISQFVKITKDTTKTNTESTNYGTVVEYNGSNYVKLDGSDYLTPVSTTADAKPGERVVVMIKNHTATVTGNLSSPAARTDDVKEIGNQISEFEIIIADKVSTQELEAESARIDSLVSDNVTIRETLTVYEADISELETDNVTIKESLTANTANITRLETEKLDAEFAGLTYATITDLQATDADIHNLEATYADFTVATADRFTAIDATISDLDATKLSAAAAELTYANIDFSNIDKAAMEYFYAQSGLIEDVVVGDGTITGNLVGVRINGDLIEAGTLIADRLMLLGEDGLYYRLNTDGVTIETEQTPYNSLNGNVILAQSITASKVNVDDLVAFDATIGGFKISNQSIYSGVKQTVDNTTKGIYLDKDGQMSVGDASNFIKYYKQADGTYKLDISANSIVLGTNKSLETEINEMNQAVEQLEQDIKDFEDMNIGARNLIRNSTSLVFTDYYFTGKFLVTHDGAGKVTVVRGASVSSDGSGNVSIRTAATVGYENGKVIIT